VHANELRPAALTAAIGRGDFYASTGIRLDDIVTCERRAADSRRRSRSPHFQTDLDDRLPKIPTPAEDKSPSP